MSLTSLPFRTGGSHENASDSNRRMSLIIDDTATNSDCVAVLGWEVIGDYRMRNRPQSGGSVSREFGSCTTLLDSKQDDKMLVRLPAREWEAERPRENLT